MSFDAHLLAVRHHRGLSPVIPKVDLWFTQVFVDSLR